MPVLMSQSYAFGSADALVMGSSIGRYGTLRRMRRVSEHAWAEFLQWGCNPGFIATSEGALLIDTPQQPIDALRWREHLVEHHGRIVHLVNTEPHPDHIRGNAYFPGVEVIGQAGMPRRYAAMIPMMTGAELGETLREVDPDSVWLFNHPDYPPNPPTRTFDDRLVLELGGLEIQLLHTPGHTAPQTAVYLPSEGVVFTGDNVFHKCKTFIQEADPWQWLATLDRIGQLDAEVIVPGHGEPCDKRYLAEQARVIRNWLSAIEDVVRRGLSEEDALAEALPFAELDPYAPGQRLWPRWDEVNTRNIRNLYTRVRDRVATA
jgi:cyclase